MQESPSSTLGQPALSLSGVATPSFLFSKKALLRTLDEYKESLPPNTEICYALKANSEPQVLELLSDAGCSFEVASEYELEYLKKVGVIPSKIIYGTSVKPADSIAVFHEYGVDRYAFDSQAELQKIAENAPYARVYLRVLVDDRANSVFTMSEKFGTHLDHAVELLTKAQKLGLRPYGISFNVGSQARNGEAWTNAIQEIVPILKQLQDKGIKLEVLNLGGGFPYDYGVSEEVPSIKQICASISESIKRLPYDMNFIAEPGRGLVASCMTMVTSVFAVSHREDGEWVFVDGGAYNALLEAMPYQGLTMYKIRLLRDSSAQLKTYIITGPTGDSLDVIGKHVQLPSDIKVGDRLVVNDVGAYSLVLYTPFNGFPKPQILTID